MDAIDDANELQAIGRAHRIGQTKTTFVYRYTMVEKSQDVADAMDIDLQ